MGATKDTAERVKTTVKKAKTRWQTASHVARIVLIVIVLLLVVGRLIMPYSVQRYVNRTLNRNADYGGRIGRVSIHLYRGAYAIHHIDIVKKGGKVPVPFLSARTVDFSVSWHDLFHGMLVSVITIDDAHLNFVSGPTKEQSQTGAQKSWVATLEDLFPFKINRCEIRQSQVWYHDFHSNPQVHIYVTNMFLVATNLSNARNAKQEMPASFQVHGKTIGDGQLQAVLRMNPLAPKPTFQLKASVTNMDLTALNEFLRAYAKADVRGGRLDVYTEMAAADGRFEGYVKPLATDLKVFNVQDKNPIEVVWEAIVAFVAQTFKNHPHDRFGTKIPFSGSFDSPKAGVWPTILNVLRNTFIKAIPPGVEGNITPQQVRQDASQGNTGKTSEKTQ